MAISVGFNPMATTNAPGTFTLQSDGMVQGVAMDDPAIRNSLAGGVLATSETLPMWGGCALSEYLPSSTSTGVMGQTVARATVNAGITGFCVYNQAHHGVTTPQSQAPVYLPGMSINFYRLGSGARIPLAIDPTLISLDTGLTTQQVSWDFTNQKIIAYNATLGALNVRILYIAVTNCYVMNFATGTSLANWTTNGACALVLI